MRPEGGGPRDHSRRCGRARLASDVSAITSACGMPPERPLPHGAASWNVAPTDPLPSVREDAQDHRRSLQVMRWGLVAFWRKGIKAGFANINAKTEGVSSFLHIALHAVRRTLHVKWRSFGSWPLFVSEATCPDQIQRPESSARNSFGSSEPLFTTISTFVVD